MTEKEKDKFMEWFPLYVDAFLLDVAQWSEVEIGVYIKLLCYQWRNGFLINSVERLRAMTSLNPAEFKKAWAFVSKKFIVCKDGNIRNRRLEEVREEQLEKMNLKEMIGRNAANKRWGNPDFPEFLNTKQFLYSWNAWKDYRREMHKFRYKTKRSEQAAVDKLARECGGDQITALHMIENSIAMQYMGIYPVKKSYNKQQVNGRKDFAE